MDDRQIVDLYWARSEQAIAETEKKYGRYCHYIAYGILCNDADAEEIVNDTLLKTWNTIPPNRPDPLGPYVGRISRQLALNASEARHAQKRDGGTLLPLEELAECLPDRCSTAELGENLALREALNKFVLTLPERTQCIFVRRYWYMLPAAEVAKGLGMTENHVNVLLHITRQKLKKFLKKEGFDS